MPLNEEINLGPMKIHWKLLGGLWLWVLFSSLICHLRSLQLHKIGLLAYILPIGRTHFHMMDIIFPICWLHQVEEFGGLEFSHLLTNRINLPILVLYP